MQVWPTTTSPSSRRQIDHNKSDLLPSDLIGGLALEHSSLGDQMTKEKSWSGDVCTPRMGAFPLHSPWSPLCGETGRPSREGLGLWVPKGSRLASPCPVPREGRTEGHSTAQPPLPHHPESPQPQPQRQEKAESSWESISQVGTLGLSVALHPKGLAESPLKPLVLKLVRCLVLINELRVPHP